MSSPWTSWSDVARGENLRSAPAIEPTVVERPLSDTLKITSFAQEDGDQTFYTEGLNSHAEAVQTIFDAHGWPPYYDPGWNIFGSVGGRTAASGIRLELDPSLFDSRDYVI